MFSFATLLLIESCIHLSYCSCVNGIVLVQFVETRYDFRAGFWGTMGGPGQGIIPVRST